MISVLGKSRIALGFLPKVQVILKSFFCVAVIFSCKPLDLLSLHTIIPPLSKGFVLRIRGNLEQPFVSDKLLTERPPTHALSCRAIG